MIINTLSSDPAVSLELGRRIARTEQRRRQGRRTFGAVLSRLFSRHPVKLIRAHA